MHHYSCPEIMDESLIKLISCDVCGNNDLISVLNLGHHPLCDDLIRFGDDSTNKEYPIEILFCNRCKTAHQKYQIPKEILFPETYHYRTKATAVVLNGLRDLVNEFILDYGSVSELKVLDIGCNDGSLLDIFKEKGAHTYGVEPTSSAYEAMINHEVIKDFFHDEIAEELKFRCGSFDIITLTNVFAHIEDLESLIKNLKTILSDHTILIIENHYLGSVLKNYQFDTFYLEHPRTYSLSSFIYISNLLGRNISNFNFPGRDGGNIRIYISKEITSKNLDEDIDFIALFKELNIDLTEWKEKKRLQFENLFRVHGPLPAKAFPGRATILINLLKLSVNEISAVYEIKGSIKTGKYVPGTRIPILPEAELYKIKEQKPIINLAWHIPQEVRKNLAKNNYLAEVIDIK